MSRNTDVIKLDHTCEHCGEDFTAQAGKFYTSTDRIHGVEEKYLKAKCTLCGKWGKYPLHISVQRTVTNPSLPKWDHKKRSAGRARWNDIPSDLKQVLEEEERLRKLNNQED